MTTTTSISWTANEDGTPGRSWNPIRGCSRASEGCENCYAEVIAGRFCDQGLAFHGYATRGPNGARWTRRVDLLPEHFAEPLGWRGALEPDAGLWCFANSTSDLFHEDLALADIAGLIGIMHACMGVTWVTLTKRAERLAEFDKYLSMMAAGADTGADVCRRHAIRLLVEAGHLRAVARLLQLPIGAWPAENIIGGVSVETQNWADRRVPALLRARWMRWRAVSYEPALGPVDFTTWLHAAVDWDYFIGPCKHGSDPWTRCDEGCDHSRPALDWVIVGGESGNGARPFDLRWPRAVLRAARSVGTHVWIKQLGRVPLGAPGCAGCEGPRFDGDVCERCGDRVEIYEGRRVLHLQHRKGEDLAEWPLDLRMQTRPRIGRGVA